MIVAKHIGWDDMLIRIEIKNLRGFIDSLEITLKQNLKDFKDRVDAEVSKMSKEEKEEYFEYLSDDHWRLSEVFPQISRRALFAICYATMEFELNRLCHAAYADSLGMDLVPKRPHLNDSKKYLIDKVRLQQQALQDLWNKLDSYRCVRNKVVHHNSTLGDDEQSQKAEEFISKEPSISIGQFNRIELGDKFCMNFVEFMNKLTAQLVSELRKKPTVVQAKP